MSEMVGKLVSFLIILLFDLKPHSLIGGLEICNISFSSMTILVNIVCYSTLLFYVANLEIISWPGKQVEEAWYISVQKN